jgi:hypothetical protein
MTEYPETAFAAELKKPRMNDWARESVDSALRVVYRNLPADQATFADLPIGYEADATREARKRAALAGYRLASELRRLFPATSAPSSPTNPAP